MSLKALLLLHLVQLISTKSIQEDVLTSINEHLMKLDQMYTLQLAPTIQNKLDQYQRKLDAIDTKIIRLEALLTLKMDKISENMYTKNFNDDMAYTNLQKKIDTVYEALSHRLGYFERKQEGLMGKLLEKVDIVTVKLEKIDDGMVDRDSNVEAELTDAVFAMDDMKTAFRELKDTVANSTKNNKVGDLKIELNKRTLKFLNNTISKGLEDIENRLEKQEDLAKRNAEFLVNIKDSLNEDLNSYANKVSDATTDLWRSEDIIQETLNSIALVVNSTKNDFDEFKTVLKDFNKGSKEVDLISDEDSLLEKTIERILNNQELFLESCHRLQMDESQIESEISLTLKKLIDTLNKKITLGPGDVQKLEKLIRIHDKHISRSLFLAQHNVSTITRNAIKQGETIKTEIKEVKENLTEILKLLQNSSNCKLNFNETNSEAEIKESIKHIQNLLNTIELKIKDNIEILTEHLKYQISRNKQNIIEELLNNWENDNYEDEEMSNQVYEPINETLPNIQRDQTLKISDEDAEDIILETLGSSTTENVLKNYLTKNENVEDTTITLDDYLINESEENVTQTVL